MCEHSQKSIFVNFSGDKGGGSVKFHFEVANMHKTCVFDVHMFCIYFGGSDCSENIDTVLRPYRQDLIDLQNGFDLFGYKVEVVLGGDFLFLDNCISYQGAAASFPCSKCYVSQQHLRNHGTDPHTPEHCQIEKRSIQGYLEDYEENLAASSEGSNLRKTGKNHYSVFARQVFPLLCIDHVVPAILHIKLGIVKKLFDMLLDECRILDGSKAHFLEQKNQERHLEFQEKD